MDEVKEFHHEGEGEKLEHLNSVGLHAELENEADAAEV